MIPARECLRFLLGTLAALAGLLATAQSCHAQGEEIKLHIVAILATDQNKEIDPRLKEVARKVQQKRPQLTGFKVQRSICVKLTAGKEEKVKLVDDQEVTVLFKCKTEKDTRCCLTVTPPRMGAITYDTACDKFFPIVTRYQTKDRQRLIIAVMVPPCDKKNEKK